MPIKPCTFPPIGNALQNEILSAPPPPLPPEEPFVVQPATWQAPQFVHQFPLSSVQILYFLATLARATYSPTPAFFTSAARAVFPDNVPIVYAPNAGLATPGYGLISMTEGNIMVISGTTNLGQWMNQIFLAALQYYEVLDAVAVDKVEALSSYNDAAKALLTASSAARRGKPTLYVGHSMGGAVAALMAWRSRRTESPKKTRLVTFAAPKPGVIWLNQALGNDPSQVKALIINGDFVPSLPPNLAAVQVAIPPPLQARSAEWSRYRPLADSYYVGPGGAIEVGSDPVFPLTAATALLAAAAGQPVAFLEAHLPQAFTTRLRAGFGGFTTVVTEHWRNANGLTAVNQAMQAAGL